MKFVEKLNYFSTTQKLQKLTAIADRRKTRKQLLKTQGESLKRFESIW